MLFASVVTVGGYACVFVDELQLHATWRIRTYGTPVICAVNSCGFSGVNHYVYVRGEVPFAVF
jgi:hypothetical protein